MCRALTQRCCALLQLIAQGDEMMLHLCGQGHNSLLCIAALTLHPGTALTETHGKVVNSQNDHLVEDQALLARWKDLV